MVYEEEFMKTYAIAVLLLLCPCIGTAQIKHDVYFIGHSLVNFDMPAMLHDIANSAPQVAHTYKVQIGIGANLQLQWSPPHNEQGSHYTTVLPTGAHDIVVLTEAVPLVNHLTWSNTYLYADSVYSLAAQYRPDVQLYVYETWHCINSGTPAGCPWDPEDAIAWRTRLTTDIVRWQSIADSINAWHPNAHAKLIPAGQAMALLYDSIAAGSVPNIPTIQTVFHDDIHLTDWGNYFVACVMYGSIYGKSPVGLTTTTDNEWGELYDAIPTATAAKLQELAWQAVCKHFGFECDAVVAVLPPGDAATGRGSTISPNPAADMVQITLPMAYQKYAVIVYNSLGQVVHTETRANTGNTIGINVRDFAPGVYYVYITDGEKRTLQRFIRN